MPKETGARILLNLEKEEEMAHKSQTIPFKRYIFCKPALNGYAKM